MAIIRNAANQMMKGRVGQTTYYISKGQQVARQSRNDSNYGESARRTELQQNRRVLWANLVEFYKASARWMPKAFESKKSGQTDYNKFMAVNVPTARIPLTKSQAEAGACVVDGFVITQGSLPSVEVNAYSSSYRTNLMIGSLTIGAETTVGELSAALIENNANCRAGMQLSFAMYQQTVDSLGTPRVNCRLYELTLDESATDLARDHIPAIGLSSVGGAVGSAAEMPIGAFAWILSELQSGQLKVSTQLLITNNETLLAQYTTTTQLDNAASSYGIDTEVILNPTGTVTQQPEPTNTYIQYIEVDGQRYNPGSSFGSASKMYQKTVTIHFSEEVAMAVTSVVLTLAAAGNVVELNGSTQTREGDEITEIFNGIAEGSTSTVIQIAVRIATGLTMYIDLAGS